AFEAGDGRLLVLCAGHDTQFAALCTVIGRPELARDERFRSPDARRRHVDPLQEIIAPVLRTRPAAEWLERLERAGIPGGPVNSVADAVRSPPAAARNMGVEIHDPPVRPPAV